MLSHISFPYKSTTLICGILPFFISFFPFPALAEAITLSRIGELDKRFQDFSSAYYKALTLQRKKSKTPIFHQLSQLDHTVRLLEKKQQHVEAIALIIYNLALIKDNIETPSTLYFIKLLLERNELESATNLFDSIQRNSNRIIISNAQYEFAKYYLERKKWKATLKYLDGIVADLVTDDAHYALLMKGFSLQNLKKHREAIKVYRRIPAMSKYFAHATLNSAVAYIRQDWWTDAHIAINEILQQSRDTVSDEMANRLFVMLGYSLMRKEYYRNARDAFRSVNLDSQYANQALLGLTLTAANQNDYIGALNAANILKEKAGNDLPTEESYLLIPYIYNKLDQLLTASAGFDEAINHYTQRIQELETLLSTRNNLEEKTSIIANSNMLRIGDYVLDFSKQYPKPFLDNLRALSELEKYINNQEIRERFDRLYSDYQATLDEIIRELLNQRISYLSSYTDQSRYGLARVYDNSPE
ncbi:MAG TPA: hypothetical protein ENG96_02870 [Gammaproteobacteria bacterium]|nr:hypothetical protein [Gammaproteobacteria bacterium]